MIVGELMTLMLGNNTALLASVAQSEAALKGYSGTAATHGGVVGSAFHAIGIAALGAGAVVGVGLALGAKAAGDFQEQMAIVNTIAHQTPAELAKTGEAIRALSTSTGTGLEDLTKGFYDLLSAGVPVAQAMAVLGQANTLAIGGLATTSQTVDLLTTAINTYGLNAKQAATATDQFALAIQDGKVTADQIASTYANVASLAHQAGISNGEIAASYAVLTAQGVPAAETTTQMGRAIIELIKPNADLRELMEKTGQNFAKIAADKGLVVALQAMRDAAAANDVPFQNLFGRLEGMKFALETTGPNFKQYSDELAAMHNANGTAAAQAAERMGTFDRQTAILGNSLQNLLVTVGTPLLPFLTDLASRLAAGAQAVTDWVAQFPNLGAALGSIPAQLLAIAPEPLRDGLTSLAGAIGGVVDAVVRFVSSADTQRTALDILKAVVSAYGTALGVVADVIRNVSGAIAAFVSDVNNQKTAMDIMRGVADAVRTAIDLLGAGLRTAVTAIAAFVTNVNNQRAALDLVKTAVGAVGTAVGFLQNAVAVIVGWFTSFTSGLNSTGQAGRATGSVLSGLGSVLTSVATIIVRSIANLVSFIATVVSAADKLGVFKVIGDAINLTLNTFGRQIALTLGLLSQLVSFVGGALTTAFNALKTTFDSISSAIGTAISAIQSLIAEAGKAVAAVASIPGVKTGSDAIGAAGGAIGNLLAGLPHFAQGGTVPGTGPQLAVVHGGEQITPAGQAQGGGGPQVMEHHTHVHLGGDEIADIVERVLLRNGSAYSSGFVADGSAF